MTKKIGMSRMIDQETGAFTPVTLLHAPACDVLQVKTMDADGYEAVVLGTFQKKKQYRNVGKRYESVCEVRDCDAEKGAQVTADDFADVAEVRITGTTKGRGFQGVVKRWGFKTGRNTHGSHHHREPGSVGMCSKPGKILKGKKLPGHYGNVRQTLRSSSVMMVDAARELIVVRGSVPGAKKSLVFLQSIEG